MPKTNHVREIHTRVQVWAGYSRSTAAIKPTVGEPCFFWCDFGPRAGVFEDDAQSDDPNDCGFRPFDNGPFVLWDWVHWYVPTTAFNLPRE